MNHLAISLLGPFQVTRDGEPVARFESDTARALLAYLVLHADAPWPREMLAGLLGLEQPDSEALAPAAPDGAAPSVFPLVHPLLGTRACAPGSARRLKGTTAYEERNE